MARRITPPGCANVRGADGDDLRYERQMGKWLLCGAVMSACALLHGSAMAQPVAVDGKTAKEQAKVAFAQGVERYERGDCEGAIEAYQRAFELYPMPMMTFNIALCHERLGRPVEAVAALEAVLAAPGKLRAERIDQAKSLLAAQKRLVAELMVTCNVDGATLLLDGEQVGVLPLAEPIPVAEGTVVLQAAKDGYRPGYATLSAPGGRQVPVVIHLEEASQRLAQLKVDATLPDAEIYVDGQLVARTPLQSTLPVTPDVRHEVVLRREGYEPAGESIVLTEGATGFVTLRPREDPRAASSGGELVVLLVQEDASVIVDGQRREVTSGVPLRLPAGPHAITASRTGYDPLNLHIEVPSGGRIVTTVDLIPTPETRERLIGDARRDAAIGWGLTIGGAVLVGAGAGTMVWGVGTRAEGAQKERDIEAGAAPYEACANNLGSAEAFCDRERLDAGQQQDLGLGFTVGGAIGLAAGVGSLVTGIVFLSTADDPDRFRLKLDDDLFALELMPAVWGQGGLGVRGRF
ncbi:MAG TPA: PEGA domain-containing protein [Polyangiaceae bacterium]|nr:PEGA domain-containing protein [Polyangiaceae bacterium]